MRPTEIKHYDHIISGGGLVGALWALYLRKRSYSVAVFQSYWDLRKEVVSEGRSINLILSRRAIQALDKIGIKYEVLQHSSIIKGRVIHPPSGQTIYLPYGAYENEVSYCIQRNKLNEILLTIAENNNVDLYFRHALDDVDFSKNLFSFATDNQIVMFSGNYLYGADGANSKVRDLINRETGGSEETHWFDYQYKELFLQAGENGNYLLDPQSVHLWPRGNHLMMGQPNHSGTFSLTLVLPSEGEVTFNTTDQQKISNFLQKSFPDIFELIPNASYQFVENPVGFFGSLFTRPWNFANKAVLMGDSAHTMVPFFWQSVNFAFNDCVVLDSCIEKYGFGQKAFDQYSQIQKPNGDAVATLSIRNFFKLANPQHIFPKQIQSKLSITFPTKFCSKYQAAFYRQHTYEQIIKLQDKNEKILKELCKNIKNVQQLDLKLAEKIIQQIK